VVFKKGGLFFVGRKEEKLSWGGWGGRQNINLKVGTDG